ncbi:hypothetical protein [Dysgonomonas macrotermitis]|uniref:Uncharacterized protein n=1 Tax=Dysgonomonas macrotermitis TaxID=1346286 RepID=A0A1M5F1Y8_9BACT|nr:hypothetical protein [Dysgonomonas macrotermitis]SHF85261.1 hypothetical protein SAMN05444362_11120 [Dysgonomonas macrotermitis]
MKKQFKLLMLSGVMASAVLASCKSSDSVVVYDDQAKGTVYRANRDTKRQDMETGSTRVYAKKSANRDVITTYTAPDDASTVVQTKRVVRSSNVPVESSSYYAPDAPNVAIAISPAPQYTPEYVDMTGQPQYNTYQAPQPVRQNRQTYQSQDYYYDDYSQPQYNSGRNKALDNNLSNRPNAYTLSDDMYTPEYRAMMNRRQSRVNNPQQVQRSNPYDGLMTVQDGNVVPYVQSQPQQQYYQAQPQQQYYQAQPQQQYYQAQPQQQYAAPQQHCNAYVASQQPQQYVVPVQPQQQYESTVVEVYSAPVQNTYASNAAVSNYPATLYFKNGAKLTGVLVEIDNEVCQFRMSEGRTVNFATKDILKIERR